MKRILLCVIAYNLVLFSVQSQVSFTKLDVTEMNNSESSITEVLDVNNDGYYDILYCDMDAKKIKILQNDKAGGFALLSEISVPIQKGPEAYIMTGDFDNDLFMDFLLVYEPSDIAIDGIKVGVYRNLQGTGFQEFFSGNVIHGGNQAVFMDLDNDGDLDIVSSGTNYIYNGLEFVYGYTPSWPDFQFEDFTYRNPNNFGCMNHVGRYIYGSKGYSINDYVSVSLDSLIIFKYPLTEPKYNDFSDGMFANLGGTDAVDKIWIGKDEETMCFFYSTMWNYLPKYKLLDLEIEEMTGLIRWDIGDVNGDGIVDIVYSKVAGYHSETWCVIIKDNNGILEMDQHLKLFTIDGFYGWFKLIDIDNDDDLDVVNAADVYLNDGGAAQQNKNGKPGNLTVIPVGDNMNFDFFWDDSTSTTNHILNYQIIINKNKSDLLDVIHVQNSNPSARLPRRVSYGDPYGYRRGFSENGWMYWSVRSISTALQGSQWADLDSFYIEENRIVGTETPCVNTEEYYYLQNNNLNETRVEFNIEGPDATVLNNNNYLQTTFNEPGKYTVSAKVYRFSQLLETIEDTIFVRGYPKIELEGPEFACRGSELLIKNIADNGSDSLFYEWLGLANPILRESGWGLDSLSVIMPDKSFFMIFVSTLENEKFCEFNGRLIENKESGSILVQAYNREEIENNFIAPDVVCGSNNATIELEDLKEKDAVYNWEVDGAEIIQNQNDSVLVINWNEGDSKEISLSVEKYGCFSDTNKVVIKRNAYPTLSFDFEALNCHGQEIPLIFTGTAGSGATYNWDFDGADIKQGDAAGPYRLQWNSGGVKELNLSVDDEGCVADTSFTTEVSEVPDTPELCGLSVNADNNAVIYWQVPQSENVDSVYIYKESVQANVYEKLAGFGRTEASSMVDTSTDCSSQAYRYKLSVLDSCGYETEQGAYHKSLHLMLNKGQNGSWNLIWSAYEGLDVGTYTIYRGTDKSNMMKIADISGNTYSFTDQYPPLGDLYYAIAISNTQSCISTLKSSSMDEFMLQSNIVETSVFNGLSDVLFDKLYTIGTRNKNLNIFTDEQELYDIVLLDVTGKTIFRLNDVIGNFSGEIPGISPGVYIVKLDIITESKTRKVTFR